MSHKFHIPVLGLGFSIDTPLKVAKFGISSVASVVDDELIERMRSYHCRQRNIPYFPIGKKAFDSRARRITAYLDLMHDLSKKDFDEMLLLPFNRANALTRYFEMLPEDSQLKQGYDLMTEYPEGERKTIFQRILKQRMEMGSIDVNIMAKVDRATENELATSDALTALRGYAQSKLKSSLVLSAGLNPRLYSYLEEFDDFYPDNELCLNKKIVLKVSDFRSALIQAKFLAKKGIWVSEFRVESGLNCGGHAFATAGYLLGPILEEFKEAKFEIRQALFELYIMALQQKGKRVPNQVPEQRLSVQGGIGTAEENRFLLSHYGVDFTGWGSPFLLVPEVTNVDDETLQQLVAAKEGDYYLSNASPLGVHFNSFKNSTIEAQRLERITIGKPGSPCTKKYLCTNTEFTEEPICTASKKYQALKLKELKDTVENGEEYTRLANQVTEKICLCEGLCSSAYQKYNLLKPKESKAVAICPGPNLAYFNNTYTLDEMVAHIYGKINVLKKENRPHMLLKELELYADYLQAELKNLVFNYNKKKEQHLQSFKSQLLSGIAYYKLLVQELEEKSSTFKERFQQVLGETEIRINKLAI